MTNWKHYRREKVSGTPISLEQFNSDDGRFYIHVRKPDVKVGVLYADEEFEQKEEAERFYNSMLNPDKAVAYLNRYGVGLG